MNAFEKWNVWVSSALVGGTGVGYFWARYMVENPDPFSALNHPLEPWFLKAHILTSPLLVLALGSILVRHVWKHFRLGVVLGRRSGTVMGLALIPMIVSGYLVQTVTHPGRLTAASWTHIGVSVLYLAALVAHQVVVHRRSATKKRVDRV